MTGWQYGSVLPGATEPDVFYETFEEAVADCAMGPCRIVRREMGPWVPVGQSRAMERQSPFPDASKSGGMVQRYSPVPSTPEEGS